MEKRRENESLEKVIKRKTRIGTLIVAAMFLVLFIIVVVRCEVGGLSNNILASTICYSGTGLILCILTFLVYKLLMRAYEDQETYKANEKIVINKLSKSEYVKVIPKYHTHFSAEFLDDLQNKRSVEFYAKLIDLKEEKAVKVYIKYKRESRYIEYDEYLPGYFFNYYDIA